MARARAAKTGRRKAAGTPRGTPEDRLIDAALALAGRQGWRRTGLAQIAAEAGLPLHEAYMLHRSKGAILRAFTRRIDRMVLAETSEEGDSPRERLFDLLMRRFEALRPYRDGLRAIFRDSVGDPAALCGLCRVNHSMRWMLEGAGVSTSGCIGNLRTKFLAMLYLSVMRVFLSDESEDLGRTMAALDRALRRAEGISGRVPNFRGRAAQASA